MDKNIIVCVTGGSSYLGFHLINQLLQKGYTVHATTRNLGDESKVGLLKNLPFADTRLVLFEADAYNPDLFASAINGCQVVVHMATPYLHSENSQYKSTSEAAVAGVKSIVESCTRSGTVKKLIYTGSVLAASPLKDDGSGYKDSIDETCWTPLDISISHGDDFTNGYVHSKTLAEQALLSYQGSSDMEIISLACGVVGGNELLPSFPISAAVLLSQIKRDHQTYAYLRFVDAAMGKVAFVHVEDVAAAHIFCVENSVSSGRYLCAKGYLNAAEIAAHFQTQYPDIKIAEEFLGDTTRGILWGTTELEDLGFCFKNDAKTTLDDNLQCAKKMEFLKL